MSILIVEDNPINAKLIELALHAKGYETLSAKNGAEALAMLWSPNDVELIITDYMMPEMNGLEFIARVKELPSCKAIHIIMASAYSNLETVKRAKELGCADFLVKPIDKAQLIERVTHMLKGAPIVLKEKALVMRTLDIGSEEYDDFAKMFAAQLAVAMPLVESEQQESEETISEQVGYMLKELAESAAFLGGEKFVGLYSKYKVENQLVRSKCTELLRALQELAAALATGGRSSPGMGAVD